MSDSQAGQTEAPGEGDVPGTNAHSLPDLDELDLGILRHLQEDGRRSYTAIADDLGVSIGTVRNRFARLVERKALHVIGRADPHQVGFHAPANIHVKISPPHLVVEAAEAIAALPETSYVALISGEYDLECDAMCRDLAHLTELVTEKISRVEGVAATKTNLILRVVKYWQPDLNLVSDSGG